MPITEHPDGSTTFSPDINNLNKITNSINSHIQHHVTNFLQHPDPSLPLTPYSLSLITPTDPQPLKIPPTFRFVPLTETKYPETLKPVHSITPISVTTIPTLHRTSSPTNTSLKHTTK